MKDFLQYTYQIVRKSLERYLNQVQQKDEAKHEESKIQEIKQKKFQEELAGGSKLRSILRDSRTNSKKMPVISGSFTISLEGFTFCSLESPASSFPMTSQYSDIVSSSVVAILKRDPRRVIFIAEKLFGQQLPLSLRQFIWSECLLRPEKKLFDHDLVRMLLIDKPCICSDSCLELY